MCHNSLSQFFPHSMKVAGLLTKTRVKVNVINEPGAANYVLVGACLPMKMNM